MKQFAMTAIILAFAASAPGLFADDAAKPKIEIVFVLDTTGSMGDLIAAAKDKIWSIVGTLAAARPAPRITLGLVGYRDRGDAYVTRLITLTDDIDKVYGKLMQFQAGGGGDGPESVNQALSEAIRKIQWGTESGTYRVVFLVGDYPPHMDYPDDVAYAVSCREAKNKGIIINTIQMGDYAETTPIWNEIARATGGSFFKIGLAGIHTEYKTPFDGEIATLAARYDGTRVYFGDRTAQALNAEKAKTEGAIYSSAPESVVAQRSLYNLSEAGRKNFTGEYELVDQVVNGKVKLDAVKDEDLPDEMRNMNQAEREKYIAGKAKARRELEKKLTDLNAKRQAYIRDEAKKNAARDERSFENQVFKSLKAQGANRNIRLDDEQSY